MKKILVLSLVICILACNNDKKDKTESTTETTAETSTDETTTTRPASENSIPSGNSVLHINIDGNDITLKSSALVSKDEKNLQAGAPWFAMISSSDGPNEESLVLNFVFDTKPGTYPVVGVGFNRGTGDNGQVFGGLMGGQPKITDYKVTLTEVRDLGDNKLGGHKWSISGTFEDMTVPAMRIMLMDEAKKHPKEVVLKKGSFSNITFDDNWEEMIEKAFDKIKE